MKRQSLPLTDIHNRARSYATMQAETIDRAVERHVPPEHQEFVGAQVRLEVFRQAVAQLSWLHRDGARQRNTVAPDNWDLELLRATQHASVPVTKDMLDYALRLAQTPLPSQRRQGMPQQHADPYAEAGAAARRAQPIHVPMAPDDPNGPYAQPPPKEQTP